MLVWSQKHPRGPASIQPVGQEELKELVVVRCSGVLAVGVDCDSGV